MSMAGVQVPLLIMITLINVCSTLSLAHGSRGGGLAYGLAGMAGYAMGGALVIPLLRAGNLGVLGPISSVSGLILVVLASSYILGEAPPTRTQFTGIAFAIVAIWLIAIGAPVSEGAAS